MYMQWFESVDLDNDGELDVRELQTALATGNLHFGLAVVAHMIRYGGSCTCTASDDCCSVLVPFATWLQNISNLAVCVQISEAYVVSLHSVSVT